MFFCRDGAKEHNAEITVLVLHYSTWIETVAREQKQPAPHGHTVTYLTKPDVFLRTVAANSWETPTRLSPSTSTIWSFTRILSQEHKKTLNFASNLPTHQKREMDSPSILVCCSSFSDCLDKDSQFFQSLVSTHTHSYDTDAQSILS